MKTNGFHPRKILIAEVNQPSVYAPLLQAEGFETEVVDSGDVALRQIQEGHCHVAVLEEDLPIKSGLDILRETRGHKVPIVICSQSWNVHRAVEAMKEGAWDYLPRPFHRQELIRAVSSACQSLRAPSVPGIIEERKRQAQKMELFGRLAGGVIHDFNNLLTVILGYCDLLRANPQTANDYIQEIEQVVQNGSALTGQLLAFARNRPLELRPLNLNFALLKLESLLARLLGDGIRIHLRLADHLGQLRADANQLEQVILNLAVNARDAMPRGGQLTFTTANLDVDTVGGCLSPGSYVLLKVTDTGCGMDEATQARMFEPFFTTKSEGQGTGLGLTTVCSIVAAAAGRIDVVSHPGQGTTFSLAFPRLPDNAPKSPVMPEHEVMTER